MGGGEQENMATAQGSWHCSRCTYKNRLTDKNCVLCDHSRDQIVDDKDISPVHTVIKEGDVEIKRRPRSGTILSRLRGQWEQYWICPQCKRHNKDSESRCEACAFKATNLDFTDKIPNIPSSSQDTTTLSGSIRNMFGRMFSWDNNRANEAISNDMWTCSKCTFINHPDILQCEQCDSLRIAQDPSQSEKKTILESNNGELLLDDLMVLEALKADAKINLHDTSTTEVSPLNVASSLTQWACSKCTFVNSSQSCKCCICGNDFSTQLNPVLSTYQRQQSTSEYVKDIRQRQEDHALATWYNIVQEYYKLGESFIDPDFPHSNHSLYKVQDKRNHHWEIAGWLRPSKIMTVFDFGFHNWCVYRDPTPNDIAQGALGNCWFLSALAVIAEVPELLQEIIITKEFCPQGVYLIRLCHDGFWKAVLVDDFFPVYANLRLAFSKARRKQLWVPLIEKALAKLYGSYEALDGGHITEGLSVLTGYPCERIGLRDDLTEQELVWAKLLSFKESNSPVDASESLHHDEIGIHPFHAYSLLDIKQIGTERIVLLRDPWGHTNWKGTGHQWMEAEEGTFWIASSDLFKYFSEVDVCHYHPDWHSVRVFSQLLNYAPSHVNVLTFQLFATSEIKLCMYQPSSRGCDDDECVNTVDMLLIIVRYESNSEAEALEHSSSLSFPLECVLCSNCKVKSTVTCSALLNPGEYAVIPLSFRNWNQKDIESYVPYVLALFSAKVIEWQESVPTKPGFVAESLFLLAMKIGKIKKYHRNVTMYEVHVQPSCYFLVIENNDSMLHLTLNCDATGSVNACSSRNGLYVNDCIPPKHKQIIMVLSPLLVDNGSFLIHYSLEFRFFRCNPDGQWGSYLSPSLTRTNRELHLPRPMY